MNTPVLNNFQNLSSLYRSLGARWLFFRVAYALRMRTGLIRKQIPAYRWKDRPLETWLEKDVPSRPEAYAQWRKQNSPRFFFTALRAAKSPQGERSRSGSESAVEAAVGEAERVLKGELKYFSHRFVKTGFPPDWHEDPISGIKLEANKHWSEISNEGDVDIKFIWEASRFSMVYTLVRAYASARDEKFAEAFWKLIESWAESNPPNMGPNWMDGQEAALRLMAWTFGFYAFLDSSSTHSERIARFTVLLAAHADRICKNIDYAIFTRSNHTISEAFGLWLVGTLFPELKNAEKYLSLGRRLLEQEAEVQIFPDGSYAMYSLNYHRFILHIYFWMIRLSELNKSPVSSLILDRISASIDYLSRLIDPETGQMPVYGSNDGALVLPLNNCDFTDYRPLLQLGSYLTRKELLFDPGPWDEGIFWLCGEQALTLAFSQRERGQPPSPLGTIAPVAKRSGGTAGDEGASSFPYGGIYLLHGTNSKAVIRCTDFRARPSHADQLHVDLWLHGQNIACDAGTYLYSGKDIWRNGLARTSVHNTVTVDRQDQMKMVSRFIWTDWAKGSVLKHDEKTWQGEHNGYRRLADPVAHKRTVLGCEGDRWLVIDHLTAKQPHHYALHWLLKDFPYEGNENLILLSIDSLKYKIQVGLLHGTATFSTVRGDPNSIRGWRSRYYGDKEPALSVMLETDQPGACFWTFFGFPSDLIEIVGNNLNVRSKDWNIEIQLDQLNK